MREPKTWVFGDVHGAYKALMQVLERAPIQKGDTIISLGDIADGWSEVYECVSLLLRLEASGDYNMIFIKGNHDEWLREGLNTGIHPGATQGGRASMHSYARHSNEGENFGEVSIIAPDGHLKFFRNQINYYKDEKNRLFVHGGFNRHMLLKDHNDPFVFFWDRDLWHCALSYEAMQKGLMMDKEEAEDLIDRSESNKIKFRIKEPLSEIFIGHTTTGLWSQIKPMHAGPIWNLDTGAGFEGVLTIMDADTHEYWQSDKVRDLYPEEHGRRAGGYNV